MTANLAPAMIYRQTSGYDWQEIQKLSELEPVLERKYDEKVKIRWSDRIFGSIKESFNAKFKFWFYFWPPPPCLI